MITRAGHVDQSAKRLALHAGGGETPERFDNSAAEQMANQVDCATAVSRSRIPEPWGPSR
jgi:hypothetical protein